MTIEWMATVGAVLSLAVVGLLTSSTRVGPALLTMGKPDERNAALREAVQDAMLRQNAVAFRLVIVSGAAAGIVLLLAVVLMVCGYSQQPTAKVIQIVCGLGNSALFRYFYKVWRESREVLVKLAT
jgi:hypothetical protein